jgi:hypothetical protein
VIRVDGSGAPVMAHDFSLLLKLRQVATDGLFAYRERGGEGIRGQPVTLFKAFNHCLLAGGFAVRVPLREGFRHADHQQVNKHDSCPFCGQL